MTIKFGSLLTIWLGDVATCLATMRFRDFAWVPTTSAMPEVQSTLLERQRSFCRRGMVRPGVVFGEVGGPACGSSPLWISEAGEGPRDVRRDLFSNHMSTSCPLGLRWR